MSILLYKKGNTHTINGIDCELVKLDPDLFNGVIPEGCFFQPEDIYKVVEVVEEIKEIEEPVKVKPKARTTKKTSKKG